MLWEEKLAAHLRKRSQFMMMVVVGMVEILMMMAVVRLELVTIVAGVVVAAGSGAQRER